MKTINYENMMKCSKAILCKTNWLIAAFFTFCFLALQAFNSHAQDAHFSQYYASPILLNPAQTGVFTGSEFRVVSQYRSQWGSLTPNFSTVSLSTEKNLNKNYGVGAFLLNDDGVKAFNTFHFVLSGSYVITSLSEKDMILSVGLQTGVIYKYIKKDGLVFDSQYDSGLFNSDLPSGESIDRYSRLMPEVNIGINYEHTKRESLLNPYGSFALMHCTYPKESFLENGNSRLPLRYILMGGTKVNIKSQLQVDPKLLIMKQSNNYELNMGLNSSYNYSYDLTLTGGLSLRLKDAFIMMLGCRYKNITYRVSYDVVTSPLKTYTRGRGGLEFSVVIVDIKRAGSLL